MKLRFSVKLLSAAALGLAFSAVVGHAQLMVNVSERLTFGAFVGGANNSVVNNGVINSSEIVYTGFPSANPFSITFNPLLGPSVVNMGSGTLNVGTFTFSSPLVPTNTFSSLPFTYEFDFDSDGVWDLTQNYTLKTAVFTAPNGINGINYTLVPDMLYGSVMIGGHNYAYASVVSNGTGTLFDGSNTVSAIQFGFLATPVPEPSTYAFAGVLALGGMIAARRRKQQKQLAA